MQPLKANGYHVSKAGPIRRSGRIVLSGLLLFAKVLVSSAQSCSGVLGEPIVNETFGTGPAGMLPAGRTTFQYRPKICVDDGEYTVADTVDGWCHGQAWHDVREDHTPGDVRGDMLVVNASYQPAEFYSQSVSGLCTGTTYEFSLWVLNLNLPRPPGICDSFSLRDPNIVLQIQTAGGTVLKAVATGAVPRTATPTWVRFALLFTMPSDQEDVVVKLINKGLGGCGNDLVLDDIQFRPCQPTLGISFASTSASSLTVCQRTSQMLTSDLGAGYVNPVYQWQERSGNANWTNVAGATAPTYSLKAYFLGKRDYRLLCIQAVSAAAIESRQCNAVSNVLSVSTLPIAYVNLGPDTTLCLGNELVLTVPSLQPPGSTYRWYDDSKANTKTFAQDGYYWLETRLDDCTYRDSVAVSFLYCPPTSFYVPGAFTPNGDGRNDQLAIFHGEYRSFALRIYNRWGNLVFVSRKPDDRWDGNCQSVPCAEDEYTWVIEYTGTDQQNKLRTYTQQGNVLLMRR